MVIRFKKKEIYIHFPYRQVYLSLSSLVLVGISIYSFFYYQKYIQNLHSEEKLSEAHQQITIPQDVKTKIQEQPHYASISATIRVPILMYHYVEIVQNKKDTTRQTLDTPPSVFDTQLKTLSDAGYTFMTNADLADVLDGKKNLPVKPILITFDDGYRDFYTDVFPILKKYQVKATAYMVPGFFNKPNYLLLTQAQEIASSGLVEVGAHTVDHASLKKKSLAFVTSEVANSKTMLEQMLHVPVVSFAYPYGSFDEQALEVVKSVGFRSAASTIPGIDQNQQNRFFLYRLRAGNRTGNTLLYWLQNVVFKK